MNWKGNAVAWILIATCLAIGTWLASRIPGERPAPVDSTVRFRLSWLDRQPSAPAIWADFEVPAKVFDPSDGGSDFQRLKLSPRDLGGRVGAGDADRQGPGGRVWVALKLRRLDIGPVDDDRRLFEAQHRPFPPAGTPYDPSTRGVFNAYWFAAGDGEQVMVQRISAVSLERRLAPHVFAVSIAEPQSTDADRELDAKLAGWLRRHLLCVRVRPAPEAALAVVFDGSALGNSGCAAARQVPR